MIKGISVSLLGKEKKKYKNLDTKNLNDYKTETLTEILEETKD